MSDQTATLALVLELKAKVDEVRKAQSEILGLSRTAQDASKAVSSIASGFTAGLGIGGALSVLGAVKSTITEIVSEMKGLVLEGVSLNKEFETAQIGIAGALKNFYPERFATFGEALKGSADVIDILKKKSADFGISFVTLADLYRANVGAMLKGGISDIQKQIDLTVLLQRTMVAFGITGARATRDIIDILNGAANRTVIAKELDLHDAQIKQARDSGQLYEFLTQKLSGFQAASDAAQNSTAALEGRLANSKAQVAAEATKELTASYHELLKALIDLVNSDGFKEFTKFTASISTDLVNKTKSLVQAFTINDPNKSATQNAAGLATDLKGADSSAALDLVRKRAIVQRDAVLAAIKGDYDILTDSFKKSAYGTELGNTLHEQLGTLNAIIAATERRGAQIVAQNQQAEKKEKEAAAAAAVRIAEEHAGAELDKNATKIDALSSKLTLVGTKDEERLEILQEIVAETNKEFDLKVKDATGPNQVKLLEFERSKALLPILNQQATVEGQIAAEKERAAKAQSKELDQDLKAFELETARHAIDVARADFTDLEAKKSEVKSDRFKTDLQKNAELIDLLKQERDTIDATVISLRAQAAATADVGAKRQLLNEASSLENRGKKIPTEENKLKPDGFSDSLVADLVTLQNRLGTVATNTAEAISSSIGGAVSAVSSGISQWILRAKTFGDAMREIGRSILNTVVNEFVSAFVKGLARMLIEYITTKNAMFLVDTLMAAKGLALSALSAAKSLILWIPSAIAASISSYGLAAAIGAAAVLALVASRGFEGGGYTGDGPPNRPTGIVHAGEWVIPAGRVRDIGIGRLSALTYGTDSAAPGGSLTTAPAGSAAADAGGSGGGGSSRQVTIVNHIDGDAVRREVQNSEGEAWVMGVIGRNRHKFNI